jgi:DNA-binding transcriptional LysR family regulator
MLFRLLCAVRILEPRLKRTGAILWHRTRYRTAAATLFAQMVKEAHALPISGQRVAHG